MPRLCTRTRFAPSLILAAFFAFACGGPQSPMNTSSGGGTAGPGTVAATVPAPTGTNGPGLRRSAGEALTVSAPRTVELSHVEPRVFAAALGQDPARIFAFVRDQIAYEPYAGALRGPRGTLLALAGNAVDRAALLASLLTHAGQRVRFARGTLPEREARDLVSSIWADRLLPVAASAGGSSPDLDAAANRLRAAIERDAPLLRDLLRKAGYPTAGEPPLTEEALLKETRDHYWVEWSHNGTWTAMDPSFPAAIPGQTYARAEQTIDALPDSLFHQVDLRVRVEEHAGASVSTRELLRYSGKAADLSNVDLLFRHQPDESNTPGTDRVRPVLMVGREAIVGLAFSVRAPRGNAFGGMADFLGGGADPDAPIATAEFIEMDFLSPTGVKDTVVREVFDRVGRTRRLAAQSLTAEQVADATRSVTVAELSGPVFSIHISTGAIDAQHLRDLAAPPAQGDGVETDARAGLKRLHVAFLVLSDGLLGRLASPTGQVGRTYLETPRVNIADLSEVAGAPRLRFDLRRDGSRAVTHGFRREAHFQAHLLRAAVNGALERTVTEYFAGAETKSGSIVPAVSTTEVFERARTSNTPLIVVAHNSSGLRADTPVEARARIDEALRAGSILVTPQAAVLVDGVPRLAWWQVDPHTGAAVPMTDDGLHGAQVTVEAGIIRTRDGHTHIMFSTSRGQRIFHFQNEAQANRFIEAMAQRLFRAGVDVEWIAIGL